MYKYSGQVCVREDLIQATLDRPESGIIYEEISLKRRWIEMLFRAYQTTEFSIHYYDDEPELRDDISYNDPWWDTPEGQGYIKDKYREHEEKRMSFNNWIDVFGAGVWGWTQQETDDFARKKMTEILDWPVEKSGRIYLGICAESDRTIYVYCYGRDFLGEDFHWVMSQK